jgi:hypothetical protein
MNTENVASSIEQVNGMEKFLSREVVDCGDGEYYFPFIGEGCLSLSAQLDWAIDAVSELASSRSSVTFTDAKERINCHIDVDVTRYGRDQRVCGLDHFINICTLTLHSLQRLELDIRIRGIVPDWIKRDPEEQTLPEPCPGCGVMLDESGCDVNDVYHYGPESCANYPNHNGWQDSLEGEANK